MSSTRAALLLRVAWLSAFAVPLVLAALLLGISRAHAAPDPAAPAAVPSALNEEFEAEAEEEGEFDAGECEEAKTEFAEGELSQAEVDEICEDREGSGEDEKKASGSNAVAPEECLLRSANARVVAYGSHDNVRLTIGYTTYEPTAATIDYSLSGGKGSLHLGTIKRHLGRSGVIRLTKALADPEMARVDAAGHFVVRLHVAGSPSSCRHFETEQLNVKRASKSQAVWSRAR